MALDADELQYERGYGPCVNAGRAGQMFLVDDMRTEQRWPDHAQNVAVPPTRSKARRVQNRCTPSRLNRSRSRQLAFCRATWREEAYQWSVPS